MPSISARDIDFYYEDHGAGPPIVVAHGMLGSVASATSFGFDAAHVATHGLRVVSYDARGHGRSGYTQRPADYTWAALAQDMSAVTQTLGLGSFGIYATSMGAGSALLFALEHPERVTRLVLRAPPPFESDLPAARRRMAPLAFAYRHFGTRWTARLLAALPGPRDAAMSALFGAQRAEAMAPALRGLLRDSPPLPLDRMSEIRAPTLILAHPRDVLHPLRSAEELRARMPHATLLVAPSATHWRAPTANLSALVANFLARGELPASV